MTRKNAIVAMVALGVLALFMASSVPAQAEETEPLPSVVHGQGFVDEDGDGYNDNAPDYDGDGIPNGQDPDWLGPAEDGTGYQHGNRKGWRNQSIERNRNRSANAEYWWDYDGDGIPNGQDPDWDRAGRGGRNCPKGRNKGSGK